jgi:hypothetical protein
VGVLGSFFVGWSFVGLCLWFRYPISGDEGHSGAQNMLSKQ